MRVTGNKVNDFKTLIELTEKDLDALHYEVETKGVSKRYISKKLREMHERIQEYKKQIENGYKC